MCRFVLYALLNACLKIYLSGGRVITNDLTCLTLNMCNPVSCLGSARAIKRYKRSNVLLLVHTTPLYVWMRSGAGTCVRARAQTAPALHVNQRPGENDATWLHNSGLPWVQHIVSCIFMPATSVVTWLPCTHMLYIHFYLANLSYPALS